MLTISQQRAEWTPMLPQQLIRPDQVSFNEETLAPRKEVAAFFPFSIGKPLLKVKNSPKNVNKPMRIGVVFSGGQAPGGHNVIAALYDTLQALHPDNRLFGFLGGGQGILDRNFTELTQEAIAPFRNQGGFDLLGSGRTKLDKQEQLAAVLATVQNLQLNGLVIIGGDDSNTNAAFIAEYFLKMNCETQVIGVPKTIDNDLQSPFTAASFGFDTASKVYAEIIGNIARDALSARKYYHFIRLMGRSASHITLECALLTHPNAALIGEEVLAHKRGLAEIVRDLADLIVKRSEQGKNYGVVLVPEGLIEFIPDFVLLIKELNALPSLHQSEIAEKLSQEAAACFNLLTPTIQRQLLSERDPHGNIPLSSIETERFLIEEVKQELARRQFKGKFNAQSHFLGYEGRSAFPTPFDCNYCYALGCVTAHLLASGATGYMSFLTGLEGPVEEWRGGGVPLTTLIDLEMRQGVELPVIKKTLVNLDSPAFRFFAKHQPKWRLADDYQFPGPIQFSGPPAWINRPPLVLSTTE